MLLNIISWIAFGVIVGYIATILVRSLESQDINSNVLIGIVGAVVGGSMFAILGDTNLSNFSSSSLITAIFGSLILIASVSGFRRI